MVYQENRIYRLLWLMYKSDSNVRTLQEEKNSFSISGLLFRFAEEAFTSSSLPLDATTRGSLEKISLNPLVASLFIDRKLLIQTKLIGRGATGEVAQVKYLDSFVALKSIALQEFNSSLEEDFLHELQTLNQLRHPNIVQLLGCTISFGSPLLGIILEFMANGSLRKVLDEKQDITWLDTKCKFAMDICKGMIYLHEKKFVHRDLKSENILVNSSFTCKIADFATSAQIGPAETMTCVVGTPFWRSPEMLSKYEYDEKTDLFSFSLILLELQLQRDPFANLDALAQIEYPNLVRENGFALSIPPITPQDVGRLIKSCGNKYSYLRPSFNTVRRKLQKFQESLEGYDDSNEKSYRELGKLMFDQIIVSQAYTKKEYSKGAVIIEIGTIGKECFIVLSGEVEIQVPTKRKLVNRSLQNNCNGDVYNTLENIISRIEGRSDVSVLSFTTIGKAEKYDYFGEMALLTRMRRAARCIASKKVTCISFDENAFESIFDKELKLLLAANVLSKLSKNSKDVKIDSKYETMRQDILLRTRGYGEKSL